MSSFSGMLAPLLLCAVMAAALLQKKDAYGAFAQGAARGVKTALDVLPYVAAMLMLSSWIASSGLLSWMENLFSPLLSCIGVQEELTAFALLRPFSGSGALALLSDICMQYGADSKEAFTAAVMMGSTETLFYTFALYFGAAGVKKTRYALLAALLSTIAGYAASALICSVVL